MYKDRYRVAPIVRAVEYHMDDNSTQTTIASPSTFYKVDGSTSEGALNKGGFTLSSNRATYSGPPTYFKVDAIAAMTGGSNKVVALRVAVNGTTISSSQSRTTTTSGRSENAHAQTYAYLTSGDYVEAYIANTTDTTNITVKDLSVTVEAVK